MSLYKNIPEIKVTVTYKGAKKSDLRSLTSTDDAADLFRELLSVDGMIHFREEFVMLCLNQANKCIGYYRVSSGGTNGTVADVRIIATIALQCQATKVIVCHNHPSGNLQPSGADRKVTEKVKSALAVLDIELVDHIIVTDESFYSFANEVGL